VRLLPCKRSKALGLRKKIKKIKQSSATKTKGSNGNEKS
jgi:hypothetical protein